MAEAKQLPTHVGLILDGNRRWARQHNRTVNEGHQQGVEVLKDIALAAFDRGVEFVSAYVFSVDNWRRTQAEVSFLMSLVSKGIDKHLDTFHRAGIRLVMLGSRSGVSDKVLASIDRAIAQTKSNPKGTLALCFNYGGKEEIAEAAQAAAQTGQSIDTATISQHLDHPEIPDIDLLIRTSGEQRLSGFMLWRAAYSELYFSSLLWPDFSVAELDKALQAFGGRQRRFGS